MGLFYCAGSGGIRDAVIAGEMNRYDVKARCCLCGRIRTAFGWRSEDSAGYDGSRYSHTYCPSCYRKTLIAFELECPAGLPARARAV